MDSEELQTRLSIINTLYSEDRNEERETYQSLVNYTYWAIIGLFGMAAFAYSSQLSNIIATCSLCVIMGLYTLITYTTVQSLCEVYWCKQIREWYYRDDLHNLRTESPFVPLKSIIDFKKTISKNNEPIEKINIFGSVTFVFNIVLPIVVFLSFIVSLIIVWAK